MDSQNSVICYFSKENETSFNETIKSFENQNKNPAEIIILNLHPEKDPSAIIKNEIPLHIVSAKDKTVGAALNEGFKKCSSDTIFFVNNIQSKIVFKNGIFDLFNLAANRSKNPGMVYSDYELEQDGKITEKHLLKHHIGRVRDNQDFGFVLMFKKSALEKAGNADESLKFNTLYDLRLSISETSELIHIANRYAGSAYRITAAGSTHNVFDYLLASKDSQLEAEEVLSEHLKNIDGYLESGSFYMNRPEPIKDAELKASVIIPVNNRPDFIGTAIESVQAQTVKEVEAVIVVNGGENDPTVQAVREYIPGGKKYNPDKPAVQLVIYDINNLGLCLNMGAWAARGQYYVQLDSDDRLKKDAVEKVYDEDPKIGMVIGSYEVWEKRNDGSLHRMENLPVVTHDEWTEENGRNNLLRINGAGAPRSIPIRLIREIGFSVNEEPYARNYGEDYAMVLKISERHRIGRVWDAIYEVIRHSGGTDHSIDQSTIDRNDEAKDFMRKEAILRRIKLNKAK